MAMFRSRSPRSTCPDPGSRAGAWWFVRVALFAALVSRASSVAAATSAAEDVGWELELLEVRLDGAPLGATLAAYRAGPTHLLPLRALSQALDLDADVDPGAGRAASRGADPKKAFELDVVAGVVTVDGRRSSLDSIRVVNIEGDLLVPASALALWLKLDLSVDERAGMLDVHPGLPLPIQQRRDRERRALALGGPPEPQAPARPLDTPYEWIGVPRVDQRALLIRRSQPFADAGSIGLETHMAGDLLLAEGRLDAAFGDGGTNDRVNGSLARSDPEGRLLGPLRARQVGVGEVLDPGLPWLFTPRTGTGVMLSNHALQEPIGLGTHVFAGRLEPGWDVELFREGALVAYAPATRGGEYHFDDVGLSPGVNEFELVFHGPGGERRVQRIAIDAEPTLPDRGASLFRVAAIDPRSGAGRVHADLDYGLGPSVALTARLAAIDLPAGPRRYGVMGVRASRGRVFGELEALGSGPTGVGGRLHLRTRWGPMRLALEHLEARDLTTEVLGPDHQGRQSRTWLRLFSAFAFPGAAGLPVTIEARPERERGGTAIDRGFTRVSAGGSRLSASWEQRGFGVAAPGVATTQREDRVIVSSHGRALVARGWVGFEGEGATQRVGLALERDLGWKVRASLEAEHRPALAEQALHLVLTQPSGRLGYSVHLDWTSPNQTSFQIALSTSLARDPRGQSWRAQAQPQAEQGAVSASAFLDLDGDGVRQAGEPPVPGARFTLNGSPRGAVSDTGGLAYLGDLPTGGNIDVSVLAASLEDPSWVVSGPAARVTPRAGSVARVDVPVVVTGEISGTVTMWGGREAEAVPGLELELVARATGKVVRRTVSGFDGFFDITGVPPGDYLLQVAAAVTGWYPAYRPIHIAPLGTLQDGVDFTLVPVGATPPAAEDVEPPPRPDDR